MAFTFKRTDTFATTVNVELPTDDPRKPNKGTFTARFKNPTKEQRETLQLELNAKSLTDEVFLDRYLVGVSGIGGADGELSADDQRAVVYSEIAISTATVLAFFSALNGVRAKN